MDNRGVRISSLSATMKAKKILEEVQKSRREKGAFQSLTQLMVEAIYGYYKPVPEKGKHAKENSNN